MNEHILSLLIFLPLAASLVVLFMPSGSKNIYRWIAIGTGVAELVLACLMVIRFRSGAEAPAGIYQEKGFQMVEKADWLSMDMGSLGKLSIDYFVGVDGISVLMVVLAAIVLLVGAIASWNISHNEKGYFALYLLLSSTVMGCFMALDFFLFYLFFEFMLLPMYFLIGLWGGPRRAYASIKFFIYTLLGSIFILLIMVGLYTSVIDPQETAVQAGIVAEKADAGLAAVEEVQLMLSQGQLSSDEKVHTFNLLHMMDQGNFIPGSVFSQHSSLTLWNVPVRLIGFLALFIGFAIKLPLVPVHTWLPDAHVEAPTPVSVVLAGILLKIGGYGFIRTAYSIFPDGAVYYAGFLGLLGIIAIIYGGLNALAQKDLKRLVAYSSISHMGFVMLGLASGTVEGVNGALFQMFSHGILSSMLFLLVGVIYDRTHDRIIDNYSGLALRMPLYTAITTITFFAALGLPGFSGFVAELFVFLGAFHADSVNGLLPRWMAVVATTGLVLTSAYFLWTLQRMFFGKYWTRGGTTWKKLLTDLNAREMIMLIPLGLITLVLGIFPNLFLDVVSNSVNEFVEFFTRKGFSGLPVGDK